MIKMVILGVKKVANGFGKASIEMPKQIEASTLESVLYVLSEMPPYPAPPPNSTYQRTLLLGRSVSGLMGKAPSALSRVENAFGSIRGIVGTRVKHAPYVIDEDRQTGIHKGRWFTLQGVVRGLQSGIRDIYAKGISALLKRSF